MSKVVERGFSNALPLLEQLVIDEISLKRGLKVVKWQNLCKEKGPGKIGGGLCFDKHADGNCVLVLGKSMQFKLASQARQTSAKIKNLLLTVVSAMTSCNRVDVLHISLYSHHIYYVELFSNWFNIIYLLLAEVPVMQRCT